MKTQLKMPPKKSPRFPAVSVALQLQKTGKETFVLVADLQEARSLYQAARKIELDVIIEQEKDSKGVKTGKYRVWNAGELV